MSWWYVSSPRMAGGVELDENNIIVGGAPIFQRFNGQPAKNLGDWLRQQGDVKFQRLTEGRVGASPPRQRASGSRSPLPEATYPYTYTWGNNKKRATLNGRSCRILLRGSRRSVMVEFENGQREIVSYRALRERRTA